MAFGSKVGGSPEEFWLPKHTDFWQKERDAQTATYALGYDEEDDITDDVLRVGRSMMDDIDDRINHEFMSPSVGVTAQGSERKRFRTIPEE